MTSDPIGLEGGLNTYLYADANPLGNIDIYGLDTTDKSPNPLKPTVKKPKIKTTICLVAKAACLNMDNDLKYEDDVYSNNVKSNKDTCTTDVNNCRYEPDDKFNTCLSQASKKCKENNDREWDRHWKAMKDIKDLYKYANEVNRICDDIP